MYKAHLRQVKNHHMPTKMSRKSKTLPSQYGTISTISLVDTEAEEMDENHECEPQTAEPEQDDDNEDDNDNPDISSIQWRQARMLQHIPGVLTMFTFHQVQLKEFPLDI